MLWSAPVPWSAPLPWSAQRSVLVARRSRLRPEPPPAPVPRESATVDIYACVYSFASSRKAVHGFLFELRLLGRGWYGPRHPLTSSCNEMLPTSFLASSPSRTGCASRQGQRATHGTEQPAAGAAVLLSLLPACGEMAGHPTSLCSPQRQPVSPLNDPEAGPASRSDLRATASAGAPPARRTGRGKCVQ